MTPVEAARALYGGDTGRLYDEWTAHINHGEVVDTPEMLVWGRMIPRGATDWQRADIAHPFGFRECDAWWIWLAVGDLRLMLEQFPHPLPWVGWARRGTPRWYTWAQMERLTAKVGSLDSRLPA